jgi:hypothetical protein
VSRTRWPVIMGSSANSRSPTGRAWRTGQRWKKPTSWRALLGSRTVHSVAAVP